jgi:hypothetical protein
LRNVQTGKIEEEIRDRWIVEELPGDAERISIDECGLLESSSSLGARAALLRRQPPGDFLAYRLEVGVELGVQPALQTRGSDEEPSRPRDAGARAGRGR